MFSIPVSTLRYYDREGLFPELEKNGSGVRQFGGRDLETLRLIECLKKAGMPIRDIRTYMQWCTEGPSTFVKRREMLLQQKESVEKEIARMNQVLETIQRKCAYYDTAIADEEQ